MRFSSSLIVDIPDNRSKVELNLKKKDNRSWNLLEQTNVDLGGFNLTFGVGGRTGTIGARELVLDDANRARVETV